LLLDAEYTTKELMGMPLFSIPTTQRSRKGPTGEKNKELPALLGNTDTAGLRLVGFRRRRLGGGQSGSSSKNASQGKKKGTNKQPRILTQELKIRQRKRNPWGGGRRERTLGNRPLGGGEKRRKRKKGKDPPLSKFSEWEHHVRKLEKWGTCTKRRGERR